MHDIYYLKVNINGPVAPAFCVFRFFKVLPIALAWVDLIRKNHPALTLGPGNREPPTAPSVLLGQLLGYCP